MLRKIEISHRTIIFAVILLIGVWFLYFIRDIILQIFVALLIAIILSPLVLRLSKLKIPRTLAAFLIYVVLMGFLVFVVSSLVPPLIEQTTSFAFALPDYVARINLPVSIDETFAREVSAQLSGLPQQVVRFAVSVFSNVLTILTTIIISFYMLVGWNKLEKQLEDLFGEKRGGQFKSYLINLENKLGSWARGEMLLMIMVGLSTYLGLLLIGVPYALSLALLAGILEIIPMLGPIIAGIPAVIVGFSISPFVGIAVASLSFLIQQLENYVFVPNVMKKSVGLNPVITLLALIIGFKIAGISGAILSVPVVITLQTVLAPLVSEDK